MRLSILIALALAGATWSVAASSQVRPQPSGGDARLQSVAYREDQIVTLELAPGYQMSLAFAPDETIESVAVGDAGAWTVVPTKRGNHLFLKLQAEGVSTNMTVVTGIRTYLFDLQPLPGPSAMMAYAVKFTYPTVDEPAQAKVAEARIVGHYRVSGDRRLRPSGIADDGTSTYIEWPDSVALPAVYAIDDSGRETLVNGMMRDGIYVIDGVSGRLTFRIDRRVARATRKPVQASD